MSESVIHDIGYQRYTGPRLGEAYIARSLYQQGMRAAFGLGRGAKAKIFPWGVLGVMVLIATVLTAIRSQSGEQLIPYWRFPGNFWLLVVLFCAVVAPELVSRDLRANVLPLYVSRPLTRVDYALAKLAAMISAGWLLLAAPITVMLLGGVFSVDGLQKVLDEIGDWGQGLLVALIFAIVLGGLSLVVASLAGRRGVAAAMVAALFLIFQPAYGIVVGLSQQHGPEAVHRTREWAGLLSPTTIVDGVARWWFDPEHSVGSFGPCYLLAALALAALAVSLLLLRYRRVAR
jgi:ABC-2 type transport system permease protein